MNKTIIKCYIFAPLLTTVFLFPPDNTDETILIEVHTMFASKKISGDTKVKRLVQCRGIIQVLKDMTN